MKWKFNLRPNGNIRQKMFGAFFRFGISTVIFMFVIFIYGFVGLRDISTETGRIIGQTSAENSRVALQKVASEMLMTAANDGASYIHNYLDVIQSHVEMLSRAMTDIYSNPNKYSPQRTVQSARTDNIRNITLTTTWYAPDANRTAIQNELHLLRPQMNLRV